MAEHGKIVTVRLGEHDSETVVRCTRARVCHLHNRGTLTLPHGAVKGRRDCMLPVSYGHVCRAWQVEQHEYMVSLSGTGATT